MWTDIFFNNKKAIIYALIALIVIGIGSVLFISISRNGKLAVQVKSVPGSVSLTVDGKSSGTGTLYLTPGTHTFKASKDGFADYEVVKEINKAGTFVPIELVAVSEEAKKWAQQHQNDYTELEGLAGKQANEEGEEFETKNPIVKLLPFNNSMFTIGYVNDASDPMGNSIVLTVTAPDGFRQEAIYQIEQWGYTPSQFKITFKNYENPFAL